MRVPTVRGIQAGAPAWQGARAAAAAFGWKRAAVSVAVLLASGFAGLKGYERMRPAAAPVAPLQTAVAGQRSIVERVSLPGTAGSARQAKLSFQASSSGVSVSGIVKSISVRTGDSVKAGQEVARLDTTSLDLAVESARSGLAVAQVRMRTLLDGALPAEVASAEQTVISATSAYQKALNDLSTLQGGATAGDLATATQTLLTARNTLNTAQSSLDALHSRTAIVVQGVEAQTAIDRITAQEISARASVRAAIDRIAAEQGFAAGISSALGDLENLIRFRCNLRGNVEACATAALAAGDLETLVPALNTATPQVPSDFLPQFEFFKNAAGADLGALAGPVFQMLQAVAALPGLQARANNAVLAVSGPGIPTTDALASAVRARDAAAAAVEAAQAKLNALMQGPTGTEQQLAVNAVQNAKAALDATRAKRDQTLGGPLPSDVRLQEQAVAQADLALRRALTDQAGAVLVAPFDGVIGAITMNVGEPSGAGSVVLLDPKAMQLNATAQEADVAKLKIGQSVALTFDAFQGAGAIGRVSSIAPAADVVQGVPSYAVVVEVLQSPARGAAALDLRAGMAGTASVEVQRHDNVLAVPSRAVKRQGRTQVVQVLVDGKQETRTIRTGASDGAFSEVLEGLQAGETVVIPAAATTTTSATPGAGLAPGGGFVIPGGFGPPGR